MKKHSAFTAAARDSNLKKYYILTRPAKLSDLTLDELEDDDHEDQAEEQGKQRKTSSMWGVRRVDGCDRCGHDGCGRGRNGRGDRDDHRRGA